MPTLGPSSTIPSDARGAAIALGKFDGVHAGHQAVITSARDAADELGAPLGVAVFEPHPLRFFNPSAPPFRLQTASQRVRALNELGVDDVFELGFDAELAALTDREFAGLVLRDLLGIAHVSVGADFRFGKGRCGDVESLTRLGAEFGFSVDAIEAVGGDEKVSSTHIRAAIERGDMDAVTEALTRPWAIEGEVLQGFQRGRTLGFPTANVALGEYARPRLGVYAVRIDVGDEALLPGVASVGVNPTVGALPEPLLEAHLFDFSGDLYGQTIEVELIAFLRDEAKFDNLGELKRQMTQDVIDARRALIGA